MTVSVPIYLEAKSTQSRGESGMVTRNEVDHARAHPGTCVMGVWSGIKIVGDEVDSCSGEFRLLDFDPDAGDLRPRDYDWWLPKRHTARRTTQSCICATNRSNKVEGCGI